MSSTPPSSLLVLLLCLPSLMLPLPALALTTSRRSPSSLLDQFWPRHLPHSNAPRSEPAAGYFSPADGGGNQLTQAPGTNPPAGEPLNVILAGTSDPAVLVDSGLDGGFRNFFLGVGFAGECLGQHEGAPQTANLGDGNGYVNETAVLRWDYTDPSLGTCRETVLGGNHFRYWRQDGKSANSSAVFMATSYEMPIKQGHNIVVNGYNLGRDWLVGNITHSPIDTDALTNTSTFSGTVSYAGFVYSASISYVSGLLANTSAGVNHGSTVGIDGKNALDGLVAVLDVKITTTPKNATKASAAVPMSAPPPPLRGLLPPLLLSLLFGAISL
ncbi:hypothetical protein C8F04DRAFT_65306 [Mycena alexandri]|uniref:Uncharacterized protein n=1 Tax=Mycena alexandri TaxID=1745969 RepID=A0AAD6WXN5_9AGAR|nr:hypothetical protein C8F04DRAFT_65306 [Mycena alexandri]